MAAVTLFSVFHGASPGTPADVTNATLRWKRADNDTQDALDPVPKPSVGFNFSFRKNFKLRVPVSDPGPDNQISNLRFFSEGQTLGADRTLRATTSTTYTQGTSADNSAEIVGDIATVDVDTFTDTSPLVVNAGQVFGAGGTGDGTQDFVVLQARVGPAALAGNVDNAKGLVYRYDES